jgi:hypothetical protein
MSLVKAGRATGDGQNFRCAAHKGNEVFEASRIALPKLALAAYLWSSDTQVYQAYDPATKLADDRSAAVLLLPILERWARHIQSNCSTTC